MGSDDVLSARIVYTVQQNKAGLYGRHRQYLPPNSKEAVIIRLGIRDFEATEPESRRIFMMGDKKA